jgi:hypothetical protein
LLPLSVVHVSEEYRITDACPPSLFPGFGLHSLLTRTSTPFIFPSPDVF